MNNTCRKKVWVFDYWSMVLWLLQGPVAGGWQPRSWPGDRGGGRGEAWSTPQIRPSPSSRPNPSRTQGQPQPQPQPQAQSKAQSKAQAQAQLQKSKRISAGANPQPQPQNPGYVAGGPGGWLVSHIVAKSYAILLQYFWNLYRSIISMHCILLCRVLASLLSLSTLSKIFKRKFYVREVRAILIFHNTSRSKFN